MIVLIDPKYNPNFQSEITSKTKLAPGVTMAKFLGSPGTRTQIEQLDVDINLVARQLYLQAQVMHAVSRNKEFNDYRLIVAEGVYKPAIGETPTKGSINDYKTTGRAVVYQLIDKTGEVALEKTFDLALYIKDYIDYQELILDYDTFDPSGKMSAQVVVVMPVANETFDMNFIKRVETSFNGELAGRNELIELLPNV